MNTVFRRRSKRRHNTSARSGSTKLLILALVALSWPSLGLAGADHHHHGGTTPTAQTLTPQALLSQELASLDSLFRVYFETRKDGYLLVRSYHAEIREVFYDAGYVVMALDATLRKDLETQGYQLAPATAWRAERAAALQQSRARLAAPGERATIPGFECYQDVEGSFAHIQTLVAEHPQLASLIDIGDSWNKENGLDGYDLWVLRLTNQSIEGPKPVLFVQSAMHAREYATAQLTLDFAQQLLTDYGNDADSTWILDHHDIQLLVQANPDGRKLAETGLLWRKNTNTNHCPEALPGVDLNRNYSAYWGFDNLGSSANPCAVTYRGPFAASEPETDAVEAYIVFAIHF